MIEKKCNKCTIKVFIPDDKDVCSECGKYRYKIINHKENEITTFLKSHSIEFIHNKPVYLGESSKRPDFLIDSKFGKIVLECDEFQHKGYENEENRMIIIYEDIQLSKDSEVLFIRYNPDYYKGLQYDIINKLKYLYFLLDHFMKLDTLNIRLGVLYLFYDGFDGNTLLKNIVIDKK